ncbi:hypothetical protein ACQEU3_47030 [Spirillospora sp. CA-253888]
MICPACAAAADNRELVTVGYGDPWPLTFGHLADICHDHGKQIRACPCQHKPARTNPEQP